MVISGYGISIDLPVGWEGRIFREWTETDVDAATLHAGNFALPVDQSGYGTLVPGAMLIGHVFLALVEFQSDAELRGGSPLYASQAVPSNLTLPDFVEETVLVGLEGHVGLQRFFYVAGYDRYHDRFVRADRERLFSVYSILASAAGPQSVVTELNSALASLRIDPFYTYGSVG